jgi:molybdopterin-guanine dinucleotide biosynthesis protein A
MMEQGDLGRDAVGVVLAGGRSQRMGQEKALLPLLGEPLVARAVRRLRVALPAVVVIGPHELAPYLPGVRLLPDREAGLGPLGGLATALAERLARRVFLVACDMPFVEPRLVEAMLETARREPSAQAIALRSTRGWEPLHTLYDTACAPVVSAQLARGERSLHRLLDQMATYAMPPDRVGVLDPSGRSTWNVNTPADWERAVEMAGGEGA